MLHKLIMTQLIGFIMRQLAKWQAGIDWAKVKLDAEPRIRANVPGTIFDGIAVEIANHILDVVAGVLSSVGSLEEIINLATDGKIDEAWTKLRDLIIENFTPKTLLDKVALQCVKDCPTI